MTIDPARAHALNAFLVENDELAELTARLGRLNILKVLGCERAEIRHSNVLAWLLDPAGGHGLGDLFLRKFLSRLLLKHPGLAGDGLTSARAELMRMDGVEVRREWENCDVLVRHPSERWCLLIENKIHSGESEGQLQRYVDKVAREFPGYASVCVFLTLDGEDPSEEGRARGYVALAYGDVLDLAERLIAQRRTHVPADAAVLMAHWIESLRRLTMSDVELTRLCREIYRRHREAIDLIVEHGMTSGVLDACAEAVRTAVTDLAFDPVVGRNRVWFLPRALAAAQRAVVPGWDHLAPAYPVCWWLEHRRREGKLQLGLEAGPMDDGERRVALMTALKGAGFKLWEKGALSPTARYTRLWTRKAALPSGPDGEELEDAEATRGVAVKLWGDAQGETERAVRAFGAFDWGA